MSCRGDSAEAPKKGGGSGSDWEFPLFKDLGAVLALSVLLCGGAVFLSQGILGYLKSISVQVRWASE